MSPIPYDRLRTLTAGKLINALKRDGFVLKRISGAHHIFKHPDGRRVVVTYHRSSDTFTRKTLKNMVEQEARWAEGDLKRLKLSK